MKLTQKVDHFTMFNSFPSTSGCSQKFPPNNLKLDGWTCEVVSGMFSLGWGAGDGLAGKGYSSELW